MKEIEVEGKTVTLAVENGLKELGLRRDQVEVQVLQEGNAGFLGLGTKPARVRIREKLWGGGVLTPEEEAEDNRGNRIEPEPPRRSADTGNRRESARPGRPAPRPERRPAPRSAEEYRPEPRPARPAPSAPRERTEEVPVDREKACELADSVLKELLSLAGLADAKVRCSWDVDQGRVRADLETEDSALVIGKGGKTLESLQFLVTVIVGRKLGAPVAVQVETDGYWHKIEEKIIEEVRQAVAEVKRTGRPHRFEPMEPALRRLVHRSVVNEPEVETASEGEGIWRKVVLRPKGK